ncbi:MAG: hypothetical protein KIPDCIKN_01794 [Haliscomenobacter sp.]|jgi:hypothetical protein|nr:hypothetical protein [Haliscomenobacter sp.]
MKKFFVTFVFIYLQFFLFGKKYDMECTNSCPSNCSYWQMDYEVDNDCKITKYNAVHYYPDGTIVYSNHVDSPGFIGMSAANLGCNCTATWY